MGKTTMFRSIIDYFRSKPKEKVPVLGDKEGERRLVGMLKLTVIPTPTFLINDIVTDNDIRSNDNLTSFFVCSECGHRTEIYSYIDKGVLNNHVLAVIQKKLEMANMVLGAADEFYEQKMGKQGYISLREHSDVRAVLKKIHDLRIQFEGMDPRNNCGKVCECDEDQIENQ
jgi:hypothetical protein